MQRRKLPKSMDCIYPVITGNHQISLNPARVLLLAVQLSAQHKPPVLLPRSASSSSNLSHFHWLSIMFAMTFHGGRKKNQKWDRGKNAQPIGLCRVVNDAVIVDMSLFNFQYLREVQRRMAWYVCSLNVCMFFFAFLSWCSILFTICLHFLPLSPFAWRNFSNVRRSAIHSVSGKSRFHFRRTPSVPSKVVLGKSNASGFYRATEKNPPKNPALRVR